MRFLPIWERRFRLTRNAKSNSQNCMVWKRFSGNRNCLDPLTNFGTNVDEVLATGLLASHGGFSTPTMLRESLNFNPSMLNQNIMNGQNFWMLIPVTCYEFGAILTTLDSLLAAQPQTTPPVNQSPWWWNCAAAHRPVSKRSWFQPLRIGRIFTCRKKANTCVTTTCRHDALALRRCWRKKNKT